MHGDAAEAGSRFDMHGRRGQSEYGAPSWAGGMQVRNMGQQQPIHQAIRQNLNSYTDNQIIGGKSKQGSTFWFRIPVVLDSMEAFHVTTAEAEPRAAAKEQGQSENAHLKNDLKNGGWFGRPEIVDIVHAATAEGEARAKLDQAQLPAKDARVKRRSA